MTASVQASLIGKKLLHSALGRQLPELLVSAGGAEICPRVLLESIQAGDQKGSHLDDICMCSHQSDKEDYPWHLMALPSPSLK